MRITRMVKHIKLMKTSFNRKCTNKFVKTLNNKNNNDDDNDHHNNIVLWSRKINYKNL